MSKRAELMILDLCDEIDLLESQLAEAQAGEKEWREKFNNLVLSDIKHGEQMMGGIIKLVLHNKIVPHDATRIERAG